MGFGGRVCGAAVDPVRRFLPLACCKPLETQYIYATDAEESADGELPGGQLTRSLPLTSVVISVINSGLSSTIEGVLVSVAVNFHMETRPGRVVLGLPCAGSRSW